MKKLTITRKPGEKTATFKTKTSGVLNDCGCGMLSGKHTIWCPERKRRGTRMFTVTMGQAYYEELPAELTRLGGTVLYTDRGVTEVRVRVSFPLPQEAKTLQATLWKQYPMCWIRVEEN